MAVVYYVSQLYLPSNINSWIAWVSYSFITTVIAIILTVGTDLLLYRDDLFNLIYKLKKNFIKKNEKKTNS